MHNASGATSVRPAGRSDSISARQALSKTKSLEETKLIDNRSTYLHTPISIDDFCITYVSRSATALWRKLKTMVIHTDNWSIEMSIKKLAEKMRRSPCTISRQLKELAAVGLLEKIERKGRCHLLKVRFPQALTAINFRLTPSKNAMTQRPYSYVLYNTKNNNTRTVVDSKIAPVKKPDDSPIVVNLKKNNTNQALDTAAEDRFIERCQAELNKINTETERLKGVITVDLSIPLATGQSFVNYLNEFIKNWTEVERTAEKQIHELDVRRNFIIHEIQRAENRKKKKIEPSCRVLTEREVHSLAAKIPPDLADQVHYSVTRGALSKFPIEKGINIARKKIGEKAWTTPHGYQPGCH
jgi:DNA-binding transcriptional ArsR family regulator